LRQDVVVSLANLVFLVDVDDTLLDNDRIRADFEAQLLATYGEEGHAAYWEIQERRFDELGYRDYLGAAQEWWTAERWDPALLRFAEYLLEYPYAERLYPGALHALASLGASGQVVVLTDGDAVFQPWKVSRAGIGAAADAVLVYVHKEEQLDDVERRHPARHYVLVDDKLRILSAAKKHWRDRVTTVLPLQGQFANDPEIAAGYLAADVTISGIADVAGLQLEALGRV